MKRSTRGKKTRLVAETCEIREPQKNRQRATIAELTDALGPNFLRGMTIDEFMAAQRTHEQMPSSQPTSHFWPLTQTDQSAYYTPQFSDSDCLNSPAPARQPPATSFEPATPKA